MANETIKLLIEDLGMNGEGIAHIDGDTYFVPYALVGEQVFAQIDYSKKNLHFCTLTKIIDKSPVRVEPVCSRFTKCGGCSLQHLPYEKQLEYKKTALINIFKKNADVCIAVDDVIPSDKPFEYRNKIQLPFGRDKSNKVVLGFYAGNTHKVIPIESCPLHAEWATKLIGIVAKFANDNKLSVYNEVTGTGILRHLVARYIGGKLSVTIVINGNKLFNADRLAEILKKNYESVSLYLNLNTKRNNVILGERLIPVMPAELACKVLDIDVDINPMSFFQINDYIRDKIYTDIKKIINPTENSIIVDSYSGVGLLGATMAKSGASIFNIEIIKEAIKDADRLYEKNGISAINICGDASIELKKVIERYINDSQKDITVFLDPPRKGCDTLVLEAISELAKIKPIRLIYLSCNPATLSRDVSYLSSAFKVIKITPYDMFPQTPHLETLCIMEIK